jgi:hypothetical protein
MTTYVYEIHYKMAFRSYTWKRSMVTPKFFRALFYLEEELTISKLYIKNSVMPFFGKFRLVKNGL